METIQEILPGPKPRKDDGSDDQRRRVTPDNRPKYPDLKPHKHHPGDLSILMFKSARDSKSCAD